MSTKVPPEGNQKQAEQSSTKTDILQYLLKQDRANARELASSLEISQQAIRRHLKDLEDENLIQHQLVQSGMGRPQHVYELTSQGRDRFPHNYDGFAVSLLDTLADTVGPDQVGWLLRKQWERKAQNYRQQLGNASLPERLRRLVELRRQEGFMAEYYPLDSDNEEESNHYMVTEYNCAISSVAASFPSVCKHELEMFAQILPDCTVERTHWQIDGEHRCGYSIQPRQPDRMTS